MKSYARAALLPLFLLVMAAGPVSSGPDAAFAAEPGNVSPPPAPARAKGPKGCQSKEAMLRWKLAEAREHGRAEQARSLERALANVTAWCGKGSQKARADLDLWEKEQEVIERERELQEARESGKAEKIAKREQKLAKARRELEAARASAK